MSCNERRKGNRKGNQQAPLIRVNTVSTKPDLHVRVNRCVSDASFLITRMTQQRKQPIKWPSFRNFPFELFYSLARFIFQVLWRQHYIRSFNLLTYVHNLTFIRIARADISSALVFFVCVCSCVKRINKASRRPWNSDIRIDKIATNDIKMRGLNTEKDMVYSSKCGTTVFEIQTSDVPLPQLRGRLLKLLLWWSFQS